MRKITLALQAAGLASALAAAPLAAADRSILIGSFEELLIEGDMKVILDNMKSPSAKVSGDQQLIDAVKVVRNGLTVRVYIQEYEGQELRKTIREPLVIRLGGRNISRISVEGSANLEANQIKAVGRPASIRLSGPGSITIARIESDKLDVNVGGSGAVNLNAGQVRSARFKADGTGTITAPNLSIQQATLTQSGNVSTHLLVNQTVEISNTGAGVIKIDGKATCFIRQPGSARITCGKVSN